MADYLVFRTDSLSVALHVSFVERVLRAARVTPLPTAPAIVMGVINLHGEILPVVSLRKRFNLPDRDIGLGDPFLVARTSRRRLILTADSVVGVADYAPADIAAMDDVLPGLEHVHGVVKARDGIVFIHDLEQFLSLDEETGLAMAMAASAKQEAT